MILKHFSLINHLLHLVHYIGRSLKQDGFAVQTEHSLSHLCVLSYMLNALHLYFLVITAFSFVMALKCSPSYGCYNFFFELKFPLKMTLSVFKGTIKIIL